MNALSKRLEVGKLPPGILARLIEQYTARDDRVVVGSKVGEDATVIDFGDRYLVAKTDPVTFATDEIGWYVVNVNANDLATMGARPRWLLGTALLPEGKTDEALAEEVFSSLYQAAADLGIVLCGGHTEITYGLDRPIVVGLMLGEVEKDRLVRSSGLEVGDAILLTKGLAIEATAILAREREKVLECRYGPAFVARCRGYLYDPGISVLKEAMVACDTARIHAMHDPTEGGVATGLYELAGASEVGMEIHEDALYLSEDSARACEAFGLNPLGAISSGAMLIGTAPKDAEGVQAAIRDVGIRCDRIGEVKDARFGVRLRTSRGIEELPRFARDEIGKLFEGSEELDEPDGDPL